MSPILATLLALGATAQAQGWPPEPSFCDLNPSLCNFEVRPDLTITGIEVGCIGNAPAVTVTIANNGIQPASAYVDLWFQSSYPAMGDFGDKYKSVYFPGYRETQVTFPIGDFGDSGYVDVIVDTEDAVDEFYEDNNQDYIYGVMPTLCLI